MKKRFNQDTPGSLKYTGKTAEYFVGNFTPPKGRLGLRIGKTKKTWFINYRLPGDQVPKRHNIGVFPEMNYSQAKEEADAILADLRVNGVDPKRGRVSSHNRDESITVDFIYRHCLENRWRKHCRPKTVRQYVQNYNHHLKDQFGDLEADKVKRYMLTDYLNKRFPDDPPIKKNVAVMLSVIYRFAYDEQILSDDINPARGMKHAPTPVRERKLTDAEIVALWREWEKRPVGRVFMFQIATGQRIGECLQLQTDQIENGVWSIPPTATKNKKLHSIPLPALALEICPPNGEHFSGSASKYAFASELEPNKPRVSPYQQYRQMALAAGVEETRSHDLRRTVAHRMVDDLNVSISDVSLVLNHIEGHMVTRIHYAQSQFLDRKSRALEKWNNYLSRILGKTSAKVIGIRASG